MECCTSEEESRWAGVRQVTSMSWPVILGSLSNTLMGFIDMMMVARLSSEALAATGSAGVWLHTLAMLFIGMTSCVSTFAAQGLGRGRPEYCAVYTWQGLYLSVFVIVGALILVPISEPLFGFMNHGPVVTGHEINYFLIRLIGFVPLAGLGALSAFFQAVNRPRIPMYVAVAGNLVNLCFNYLLIFGNGGFPAWGVAGAAAATVMGQYAQFGLLLAVFLSGPFHRVYATRHVWRFDAGRCWELVRVGRYNAVTMCMDVLNWAIFTSFIVGRFGTTQLAAHNVAIGFMSVSFMPAFAVNQAIAPIVGEFIGRGQFSRAKARTHTAIKLTGGYMCVMGLVFIFFGEWLTRFVFRTDPGVAEVCGRLLVMAGFFQGFDAVNIVVAGTLRGAGDTRWMMWMMLIANYFMFLPVATLLAIVLGGEAYGAWLAATIYIIALSGVSYGRFRSERWHGIRIFTEDRAAAGKAA